jgi:TfoX/Sxy family transcriptional regulator of competence genes
MANTPEFVQFVLDQIDESAQATYRTMFGGGTLYSKAKVVALICDDQLFVKPSEAGRSFIEDVVEAPAFPNAKMSFLIDDRINDREWLTQLIGLTEAEMPEPKPKRKKKPKAK